MQSWPFLPAVGYSLKRFVLWCHILQKCRLAIVHIYMYLVTHYPVNSLNDLIQKLSLRNFLTNVIQAMFSHRHRQGHDWPATPHSFCLCLFLSQTPLIQSTWDDVHCTWVKSDRCCHGVSWSTRGKPGSKLDPFLDLCRWNRELFSKRFCQKDANG